MLEFFIFESLVLSTWTTDVEKILKYSEKSLSSILSLVDLAHTGQQEVNQHKEAMHLQLNFNNLNINPFGLDTSFHTWTLLLHLGTPSIHLAFICKSQVKNMHRNF